MTVIPLIVTLVTLAYNFDLLYNRKKERTQGRYRMVASLSILLVGIVLYGSGLIGHNKEAGSTMGYCLSPMLYNWFIAIMEKLSFSLQNRDFYIWLSYSDEIDSTTFSGGPHVTNTDRVLSMLSLAGGILLPLIMGFGTSALLSLV